MRSPPRSAPRAASSPSPSSLRIERNPKAGTHKTLLYPVYLTNTYTTNVYNNASALLKSFVRHIHVFNTDSSTRTFRLFIDATGTATAGKQLFHDQSIAATSGFDWYVPMTLLSSDFIVGGASVTNVLVISMYGDLLAV